jgi:hypothetical protein
MKLVVCLPGQIGKESIFLYVFLKVLCRDITLLLALFTSQLILLYGTCAAKPWQKFMAIVFKIKDILDPGYPE